MAAALSRLTPVHREVLLLAYFHVTQREISDRTADASGYGKEPHHGGAARPARELGRGSVVSR